MNRTFTRRAIAISVYYFFVTMPNKAVLPCADNQFSHERANIETIVPIAGATTPLRFAAFANHVTIARTTTASKLLAAPKIAGFIGDKLLFLLNRPLNLTEIREVGF